MRYFSLFAIAIVLCYCGPKKDTARREIEDRIKRIENGLQPNLQIEGEEVPTYNIEERLRELGIPGVSIAVVNNGEIEWARGYGMADSAENRKVDVETMFLAGSISKPVAATRAHQLSEQGIIDIDEDVNEYLASWKVPDNEFTTNEKVTIRRILNHTAGLTVWGFPGYDKGDTIPTAVEVLDGKGNTDSVRVYKEPGESWMYSGGGYTIMQLMITDLEKSPFPGIMKMNVLDPLGMTESTFENPLPGKFHGIAATGYRRNGDEVEGKWPIYPEMAAAGLWTTPSQLILWAVEIQKVLQTREDGLLTKETVDEMLTPGMNGHGLGPGVSDVSFGHGGADEGFRARLIAWKDTPNAVVVMVNSDNGSIIQEVLLAIATEYDLPGIEPDVKTIVDLSEEERMKYTGKYRFPEGEIVDIKIKDMGLEGREGWFDEPVYLVPENDTAFFNKKSGTSYTFMLDGETVTGFKVWNLETTKIE